MEITYRADALMAAVAIEGVLFEPGDTKNVPDPVGARILTNANFVDATGKNPNFACGGCGKTTYEIAMPHPRPGARGPTAVSLRHEDGKLRCRECFLGGDPSPAPRPATIAAAPLPTPAPAPVVAAPAPTTSEPAKSDAA